MWIYYEYPSWNWQQTPLKIGRAPKGDFIFQPSIFRCDLLVSGSVACEYLSVYVIYTRTLRFIIWSEWDHAVFHGVSRWNDGTQTHRFLLTLGEPLYICVFYLKNRINYSNNACIYIYIFFIFTCTYTDYIYVSIYLFIEKARRI